MCVVDECRAAEATLFFADSHPNTKTCFAEAMNLTHARTQPFVLTDV
jgi:hypothetical protein